MANRIQIRRDSEDNWNRINPTLADGELALTYDNNKIKVGDGNSNWSDLPYATGAPSLADVATSGNYNDLSNKPSIPQSVGELIGSSIGYSASNNRQFLRWKASDSSIEFSSDFRVVPYSGVVYPGGTIGTDAVGDVAFDESGTYYCYQTPNAYTVTYSGSTNWTPEGWLKFDTKGPGNPPQVGDKVTDGVYTSTITSIESPWAIWYGSVYMMLVNISPARSSWKNGSGSLTVYTGSEPHLNCWARLSTEIVSAPTHNNSAGVAGQIAYDSNYMYRCVTSSVLEVSKGTYHTPRYTDAGYTNQGASDDIRINNDGVVITPQNGWYITDGTNTRTITNVNPNSGQSGQIWILTLDSGVDWSSVTSLTIKSQLASDGLWKRVALSADTW